MTAVPTPETWKASGQLPGFLVNTQWLENHLSDAGLKVFDCTANIVADGAVGDRVQAERDAFEAGHIPGARFIDLQEDLSDRSQRFRFMLPGAAAFEAAVQRLGINEGDTVVIYSTGNVWWATRVWWQLQVFGFENVHVLDGGWRKWIQEGRRVETGAADAPATGNFRAQAARPWVASRDEVLAAIGDGGICFVNALSPAHFRGEGPAGKKRVGHIPGSLNVFAGSLLDPQDTTFLEPADLRGAFEKAGVFTGDREVIAYCGGGIAASADVFVLTLLGHKKVRLYDGSLNEWADDEALPLTSVVVR